MGPKRVGLGARRGGSVGNSAPPTNIGNGSGGAGILPGTSVSFQPALSEIGDVTTGRITLGMVNLTILLMIGFYVWTRSSQGGA